MNTHDYVPKKVFTPEQANAMLPLVRAICQDLSALSKEVLERKERLAFLQNSRESARRRSDDPYRAELEQIELDLGKDGQRLQGFVEELCELGVEPKNAVEGLVDFPCKMEGRLVYLCWRLGEPEVLFWHTLESGFTGRQPLLAESVPHEKND